MYTLPEIVTTKFTELFGAIHYATDDLKIAGAEANLIGDFSQVTGIIDTCRKLQNLEANIKSVLNGFEAKHKTNTAAKSTENKRLFSNKEIQEKISKVARVLSEDELEQLCDKKTSKDLFGIYAPLFIKCPKSTSVSSKCDVVKDRCGYDRWTWKFEFERNNFLYAISTQWYPRNDKKVKEWLDKHG